MATAAKKKEQPKLPPVEDGWTEVGDPYGETVDLTEGPLQGTYQGSRILETTDPDGEPRDSQIHDFKTKDGEIMSVWGSYDLDKKLTSDIEGREVRVEYLKTLDIQGGRQQLKVYRVTAREVKF